MDDRNRKYASLVVILGVLLAALYFIKVDQQVGQVAPVDYTIKYKMRYEFKAQNSTPRTVKYSEVRAFLSSGASQSQVIANFESPEQHRRLLTDGVGNSFALFKFSDIAAGGGKNISIEADIGYRDKTLAETKENQEEKYLQKESILEVDPIELDRILGEVKEKKTGNSTTDILTWMSEQRSDKKESFKLAAKNDSTTAIPTDVTPESQTSIPASSLGDVYLFVTLSRELGLPARVVAGIVIERQPASKFVETKLKLWPEYFSENIWHIVDIDQFHNSEATSEYIALRTLDRITQPPNAPIEAYLFDTVSIKIVPGSTKIRIRSVSN